MTKSSAQLRLRHRATVESFEPRCLMTAQTGDFQLDYEIEQLFQLDNQATLLGINDLTGLTSARANYGLTGAGQTVVVIDSGIAWDHAALGGGLGSGYRVVGGWDFTEENDANPYDDGPTGSHGTHVAGIIGSSNSTALGLAPGVDLVGLRVFNDQGVGYFHWIEQSLQWVHDHRSSFRNPITTVNISIGSTWNATSVPEWSSIEDELAQLKADGIFISVAAGNSFTTYNETGLSYPAASSSVVPVSAVDDNGSISYYSQRDTRVIAAPGRAIVSTVPDYVGNFNGRTDDFAAYSGTSMAAPYVAGASVLIRQAMQLAGQTGVTQDAIYQVMLQTGDVVFDSTTGQNYVRLNVGRALDTVLADDVGSTVQTARQLGSTSSTTVDGLIGRLDDRDYFTFRATQSGRARVVATPNSGLATVWNLSNGQTRGGNELSLDVVAGQSYTVGISSSSGLGRYSIQLNVEPSVVWWGAVNFLTADGEAVNGERSIVFTAANTGIYTVEALFNHAGGNVDIELFNSSGQRLASSATGSNRERVDVSVTAGARYCLKIRGANNDVDLRFTNLVVANGTTVTVVGTGGNDNFSFIAGQTHELTINGTVYRYSANVTRSFEFLGGNGQDRTNVRGTSANETLTLRPGASVMTSAGWTLTVGGVEVQSIDGGGGKDIAVVYDSADDDIFVATPTVARQLAGNTDNFLYNFYTVDGRSTAGGRDKAYFYDSAGDDTFVAAPLSAYQRGPGYEHMARGFADIEARAIMGGNDLAYFYDSAGNDEFAVTPNRSLLRGVGFDNEAYGFDAVSGYSFAGGADVAYLFDSAGNDEFYGADWAALIRGAGYSGFAQNFDRVLARSIYGGRDRAFLFDSVDNDTFRSARGLASLTGPGFYNSAQDFQSIEANCSAGGVDTAILDDTSGNDSLVADGKTAQLTAQDYEVLARGFQTVRVQGTTGVNSLSLKAIDYVLNKSGTWIAVNS